jgi:hypothetical protein
LKSGLGFRGELGFFAHIGSCFTYL